MEFPMPNYRGIDQADVVKSINGALELLETYSPGPKCQENIDKLRAVDPATNTSILGTIANTTDDKAFIAAVSQAQGTIGFMGPVLRYHGIENTDGKGLDVYKQLSSWGALGGARLMAYYPEDGEMDSFLITAYAKKLAQKLPVVTPLKNIFWSVATGGRDGLGASKKLNALVKMARKGSSDADIKAKFLELDIRDRHLVNDAGAAACHMHDGQKNNLPQDEAMSRFGLVLPELGKSQNWGSPEVEDWREKVSEILKPFFETREVDMLGIGLIKMDRNSPQGITFGSTLRAARAVAAAFPEMQVIDYKGKPVEPPQNAPGVQQPKPQV
jgi:hypothetical protein